MLMMCHVKRNEDKKMRQNGAYVLSLRFAVQLMLAAAAARRTFIVHP